MSQLVLTPNQPSWQGEVLRQSCRVRRLEDPVSTDTVIWWDSPNDLVPMPDGGAESFLIASLFPAMAEGRNIIIEGSVGPRLLANLEDFVLAWSRWKPRIYRRIRIIPDQISQEDPVAWSNKAVAAFSGGVDASYTVWRHHSGLAGHASRSISACAIIHGFDIPLSQDLKFATSLRLAKHSLDSIGVELIPLRTNLRQVFPLDWHDFHGAAVVSSLHLLKSKASILLIGSTDPFDQLLLPYGSNPLTDHLLSSGSMEVIHDGCGADRTEKIGVISNWDTGYANLRVCWKGEQIEANCGRCEKCLRTSLNCLANGIALPKNLIVEGAPSHYLKILDSRSEHILQEYDQILVAAHRNKVTGLWVDLLVQRLKRLRRRNGILNGLDSLKTFMRRLISKSKFVNQRLKRVRGKVWSGE